MCCCSCGNNLTLTSYELRSGKRISCCGCSRKTHGRSRTHTYQTWADMKRRCNQPRHKSWKDYGGRGITYCPEWEQFENFFKDMGQRPANTTLDRVNNDGSYCKENCRWATVYQQRRNTRYTRIVSAFGFTGCIADVAAHFGVRIGLIHSRLNKNWALEDAITVPPSAVKSAASKLRWSKA